MYRANLFLHSHCHCHGHSRWYVGSARVRQRHSIRLFLGPGGYRGRQRGYLRLECRAVDSEVMLVCVHIKGFFFLCVLSLSSPHCNARQGKAGKAKQGTRTNCDRNCKKQAKNKCTNHHEHTSLLPRPNPLITGPDKRIGNGASGPASGPATGSRGLSVLILTVTVQLNGWGKDSMVDRKIMRRSR